MKFRAIGACVMIVAATLALPACGAAKHPATANLSVEGKTAVMGRQLIAAVSAAASGVDVLIDGGQLPKEDGVKVLQVLRTVGVESGRLADALAVIDQTKENTINRDTAIQKASDIIKGIQAAVLRGIVPVGGEANRGKVAALLDGIYTALLAITQAFSGNPEPLTTAGLGAITTWEWMGVAA